MIDINNEWIPIMKVGYVASKKIMIEKKDLENILNAFKNKVRGQYLDIPIVSTHQGSAADGWVKDLKIEDDILYAKVEFNSEGEKKIKDKIYRYVSPEILYNYKDAEGKMYNAVLYRIALTNTPALDLKPLDNYEEVINEMIEFSSYTDEEKEKLIKEREARSKKYGIPVVENGNYIPPKEYAEAGATSPEDYADPVNYKYPINDAEFARAALNYFSKPKNHNVYPPEARDVIWERIIKACLKFGISVRYNEEYHKNLPENLKKKMEGKEEEKMEESINNEKILELEEKIKEKDAKILELEEKLNFLEKEKKDMEWAKKVDELIDNGNIYPNKKEELLKLEEDYRDVVFNILKGIKVISLSENKEFITQSEEEEINLEKEREEIKKILKEKRGGK